MKKWFLLGIALFSSQVAAFPRANPVPGGIAIIPVAAVGNPAPVVQYNNQRVTVAQQDGQWVALVGIPFDAVGGEHHIQVQGAQTIPFAVQDKQYRTQHIRLKDNNQVEPDEASGQRIVQELAVQKRIKAQFSAQPASTTS